MRPLAISELVLAGGELLSAHWAEVAREKDLMVLDPAWDKYLALERNGTLLSIGAYAGVELVGYSVGLVLPHMHYQGMIYYQNDVLFVAPEHRRSRLGVDLIEATEAAAEERGAVWHAWHAKKGSTLDRLLDRRGYGVHDIIYGRRAAALRER